MSDLKEYEWVEKTVTLQCAGNRRASMTDQKATSGLQWTGTAISNASFGGYTLSSLLSPFALSSKKGKHLVLKGTDGYEASIPMALADHAFVATEMNGTLLEGDHGYPLRVICPGIVAARSVKWVSEIEITDEESKSFWQQNDYR